MAALEMETGESLSAAATECGASTLDLSAPPLTAPSTALSVLLRFGALGGPAEFAPLCAALATAPFPLDLAAAFCFRKASSYTSEGFGVNVQSAWTFGGQHEVLLDSGLNEVVRARMSLEGEGGLCTFRRPASAKSLVL